MFDGHIIDPFFIESRMCFSCRVRTLYACLPVLGNNRQNWCGLSRYRQNAKNQKEFFRQLSRQIREVSDKFILRLRKIMNLKPPVSISPRRCSGNSRHPALS